MGCCHHYQFNAGGDDFFTVDVNRIRFGPGAFRELGSEVALEGVKNAAVFTDTVIAQLELFSGALQSLRAAGVAIEVYDEVRVEPTDQSFEAASQLAADHQFDGFVSIGGGSVIDTCKAANLVSSHPADFLAYVNTPLGEGRAVPGMLKPHIACPTTSGTGSECTGIAVFDFLKNRSKTGIMSRYLLPNRAVVDPRWPASLPAQVVAATGFDVISPTLEVFTADPTQPPTAAGPAGASAHDPRGQSLERYGVPGAHAAGWQVSGPCSSRPGRRDRPARDDVRRNLVWRSVRQRRLSSAPRHVLSRTRHGS